MIKNITDLTKENIASICDHTFLNRSEAYKVTAKKGENPIVLRKQAFENFLEETVNMKYSPYTVCVRPEDVGQTKEYLSNNKKENIKIASVVGFPDGNIYSTEFKVAETKLAIDAGADEVDFVLNYNRLKKGDEDYCGNEIYDIAGLAQNKHILTKMILETSELTNDEIIKACELAEDYGADFIKTSTGFSSAGAKPEHLKIMRNNFSEGIKMSGGVNLANLNELLHAASGRKDGKIDLDPMEIRIGESSLLTKLALHQDTNF